MHPDLFHLYSYIVRSVIYDDYFVALPDSMGSNGDQYFNATFSSEPPVPDFQPFNVGSLLHYNVFV